MPLYYVKQDNTSDGCGDPLCCGEYYKDIVVSFVEILNDELVTAGAIRAQLGGGPVLKFRAATLKELQAYIYGRSKGYSIGHEAGSQQQKLINNAT
mgnify:CR=1 FL=1